MASANPASGGADSLALPLQASVIEAREAIQAELPTPPPPPVGDTRFNSCATDLITRWEVSGVAAYTRKYQGVIWPGGNSGPTWGIGYDGGTQTSRDIALDWNLHEQHARLATASGILGIAAKQRLGEWAGIRTPYQLAAVVFAQVSLPTYTASARRALGPGFEQLSPGARCGLVSMGYNRGWAMVGSRNTEKRAIRDLCLADVEHPDEGCVADQLLAMQRLWPDVQGLRDRRRDEARVVRSNANVLLQLPAQRPATPATPRIRPRLPGQGPATSST